MNPKDAEVINYYLNDPDKIVIPVPIKLNLEVYEDYNIRTIESEEQIMSIFENAIINNEEFIVIIRERHLEFNTYNSQILYDYLNENFELMYEENYGGFIILSCKDHVL